METTSKAKKFVGQIVSDRGNKTVVVEVAQFKTHPKYQKQYKVTKKFKVHDENNEYKIGDTVEVEECRPLSRGKHWKVSKKVK